MKFRFFHGGNAIFNTKDFDTKDYECQKLFKTKVGKPVVLSKHKTLAIWKVAYNLSTLMFRSYDEAVAYCNKHFVKTSNKE